MRPLCPLASAAILALLPRATRAHHEAIFGPQSSLVLSAPGFVSAQVFTRQTGTATDRTQETTALVSGAVTPFSFPLWCGPQAMGRESVPSSTPSSGRGLAAATPAH